MLKLSCHKLFLAGLQVKWPCIAVSLKKKNKTWKPVYEIFWLNVFFLREHAVKVQEFSLFSTQKFLLSWSSTSSIFNMISPLQTIRLERILLLTKPGTISLCGLFHCKKAVWDCCKDRLSLTASAMISHNSSHCKIMTLAWKSWLNQY